MIGWFKLNHPTSNFEKTIWFSQEFVLCLWSCGDYTKCLKAARMAYSKFLWRLCAWIYSVCLWTECNSFVTALSFESSSTLAMFVYMSNFCFEMNREPLLDKLLIGWLPSHLSTSDLPTYKYSFRFEWTRCPYKMTHLLRWEFPPQIHRRCQLRVVVHGEPANPEVLELPLEALLRSRTTRV